MTTMTGFPNFKARLGWEVFFGWGWGWVGGDFFVAEKIFSCCWIDVLLLRIINYLKVKIHGTGTDTKR